MIFVLLLYHSRWLLDTYTTFRKSDLGYYLNLGYYLRFII